MIVHRFRGGDKEFTSSTVSDRTSLGRDNRDDGSRHSTKKIAARLDVSNKTNRVEL